MKVIGINSSDNLKGNTATLTEEALYGAQEAGADIELIQLVKQDIKFCTGCLKCMEKGHCILKDDFEEIRNKMRNADGIIWGAPTFCASMNARMKNFFDRFGLFERMTSDTFGGKYNIGISTAASWGAKATTKSLVAFVSSSLFKMGFSSGTLSVHLHGKTVDELPDVGNKANALGHKLVNDIKNNKKYPAQKWLSRKLNGLLMKPQFEKVIRKNKDGNTKGVYENLANRGFI
jgi:multimeric flavodoxin WrbA